MFLALALPPIQAAQLPPVHAERLLRHEIANPFGGHAMISVGVSAAAATIFFAFVGFDAVSTAAEETINPNRNIPIGLIGALGDLDRAVHARRRRRDRVGRRAADRRARAVERGARLCPAHDRLSAGAGNLLAIAAGIALPSVILALMFGQTRIFFVMARDGLLPPILSRIHPRFHTPHIITSLTGVFVAVFASIFPVESLADISNSGTLLAFLAVAVGVHRPAGPPAGPQPPVPRAGDLGHRAARRGGVRVPVLLAVELHAEAVRRLAGDRAGVLFSLRPDPVERRARDRRFGRRGPIAL